MALFAIINNNHVSNIIIAETKEIAEMISDGIAVEYNENDYVCIGMEYKNKKFIVPPLPEYIPPVRKDDDKAVIE